MDSTDLWPLVGDGYFDGRPIPWAIVLRYIGALVDAPGIWHGLECANDEAAPATTVRGPH